MKIVAQNYYTFYVRYSQIIFPPIYTSDAMLTVLPIRFEKCLFFSQFF